MSFIWNSFLPDFPHMTVVSGDEDFISTCRRRSTSS